MHLILHRLGAVIGNIFGSELRNQRQSDHGNPGDGENTQKHLARIHAALQRPKNSVTIGLHLLAAPNRVKNAGKFDFPEPSGTLFFCDRKCKQSKQLP